MTSLKEEQVIESETEKPRGPCRPGDPDGKSVTRMLAGHTAAEELDRKYRGGLLDHAAQALHSLERARRVVEDSLADAFNNIGTFRGQSTFFTWLYCIFKNRLLREQRTRAVAARREVDFESETTADSADPDEPDASRPNETGWLDQIEQSVFTGRQHTPEKDHEARERLREVAKDIHELLPPQTREVFQHILAGFSFGEIAQVLGTSEANVRGHVMRGRAVLKEKRDGRKA